MTCASISPSGSSGSVRIFEHPHCTATESLLVALSSRLGHTTLESLTPIQVQATANRSARQRWTRRPTARCQDSRQYTGVVLRKALADAVRLGLLDHNVVAGGRSTSRAAAGVVGVDGRSTPRVPERGGLASVVGGVRVVGYDRDASQRSARVAMVRHRLRRRLAVDRHTLTVVAGRPVVAAPKTARVAGWRTSTRAPSPRCESTARGQSRRVASTCFNQPVVNR